MPAAMPESPTTRLPRAIVRQSERIRQMVDDRNRPPTPADPPAPRAASPAAPGAPTAPTPASPDATAATASGLPPGDPRENSVDYWRARAQAVFGMFRRERELTADLKNKVRDLQLEREVKAAAPAPGFDPASIFSPEARQQYGDDQLRDIAAPVLQRVDETVQAATRPLQDRLEAQRQSETERRYEAFTDQLVALVPDALEIDKTPAWLEWLEGVDERSGYTYLQMLKAHESRFDAQRVAGLFQQFKNRGASDFVAPPAPTPPIAAGATGGNGGDVPPGSPVLAYPTSTEIKDFYKRSALGKVKDKERQEFEARMQAKRPG